jgi:hypothetical protein
VGREKAERRRIRVLKQLLAARDGRRKADLELIVRMKRRRKRRKRKSSAFQIAIVKRI